jgi:crotonobetainyl-CoA:carnitine CoA-transferase CaiB-like acyl-CoA transferase
MPEPLEGMTVVEMTIAVQGPAAALYLRDMGAQVIKIEPPVGDGSRYGRGRFNNTPDGTMGAQFVAANRGKRSVCIDLTTDLGMQALHVLLGDADVFLTNYREPALQKMGLGYEALHAQYPQLVYASVNGFGPEGPDADKAMLDGAAVARGGLAGMTGPADRPPSLPGAIIADTAGAMQLALATMTALLARERFGTGQRAQTSALGTQLWLQQWELTQVAMTDAPIARSGSHHPNLKGPYGIYRTADDGAIMLAQTMASEAWDAFCIFADVPELAFDARLQTAGQRLGEGMTEADSVEIRATLEAAFAGKTTDQWREFLGTQPEIIWEKVRSLSEVLVDEQNLANNYLTDVQVPGLGTTKTVGNVVRLSDTPGSVKGDPPELGEANTEVLASLGFTEAQVYEMTERATTVREEAFALLLGLQEDDA